MSRLIPIIIVFLLLFIVSCTSRKNQNNAYPSGMKKLAVSDSIYSYTLHQALPSELEDGLMPPTPPDGKHFNGSSHRCSPRQPDNMRGFEPTSEDDMDNNGMSRYMENNDDEGWD